LAVWLSITALASWSLDVTVLVVLSQAIIAAPNAMHKAVILKKLVFILILLV
jgi:hypothetical protein